MKIKNKISFSKEWLFGDSDLPIQLSIKRAEDIKAVKHAHKKLHEYFYILQGKMTILVNDKEIDLKKDDLLIIEPGEKHMVKDKSKDLLLLLLMPPPLPDDKVIY